MILWWIWRAMMAGLCVMLVMSAVQLYRVKTETRAALKQTRALEAEAASLRLERAEVEVEWSYLNAPSTLLDLLDDHQSVAMKLIEREPDSFARLSELPLRGDTSLERDP